MIRATLALVLLAGCADAGRVEELEALLAGAEAEARAYRDELRDARTLLEDCRSEVREHGERMADACVDRVPLDCPTDGELRWHPGE